MESLEGGFRHTGNRYLDRDCHSRDAKFLDVTAQFSREVLSAATYGATNVAGGSFGSSYQATQTTASTHGAPLVDV